MERDGSQRGRSGVGSGHGGDVAARFGVFSDGTRLRILSLLRDAPQCVGDLVGVLGLPQPSVSRHLALLRRAGVVEVRPHGLWMFYQLAPVRDALHEKLLECLAVAAPRLPEARADARRAQRLRRSGGCCPEGSREIGRSAARV